MSQRAEEDETQLPPPTAPDTYQVSLRGFESAAEAESFGAEIGTAVRDISRLINLQRLDGVTIAYDYDEALAQLDRGYQPSRALTRTDDDRIVGVAMAPAVLRDGVVKGHIVFYAPYVLPLVDEASEHHRQAIYLIAHECAHIEDLNHRDERFPGVILQQAIDDHEEAVLDHAASAIWEEYAACRISAVFDPDQKDRYEEGLVSVLSDCRERANEAIRSYRLHSDINRVLEEAGTALCEPLRLAAYLIGHLDGLEMDLGGAAGAEAALNDSPYAVHVQRQSDILRDLWASRDQWESRAVFIPLYDLVREVLGEGGIILRKLPDGQLYVDIPFTPETMP